MITPYNGIFITNSLQQYSASASGMVMNRLMTEIIRGANMDKAAQNLLNEITCKEDWI